MQCFDLQAVLQKPIRAAIEQHPGSSSDLEVNIIPSRGHWSVWPPSSGQLLRGGILGSKISQRPCSRIVNADYVVLACNKTGCIE